MGMSEGRKYQHVMLRKIMEEEVKSEVEWKDCANSHCLPSGHGYVAMLHFQKAVFRKLIFLFTEIICQHTF